MSSSLSQFNSTQRNVRVMFQVYCLRSAASLLDPLRAQWHRSTYQNQRYTTLTMPQRGDGRKKRSQPRPIIQSDQLVRLCYFPSPFQGHVRHVGRISFITGGLGVHPDRLGVAVQWFPSSTFRAQAMLSCCWPKVLPLGTTLGRRA